MSELQIDLNIDKHHKATLVIECPICHHELTHHLETLQPDEQLLCSQCGEKITVTVHDLERAQHLYQQILHGDEGVIG